MEFSKLCLQIFYYVVVFIIERPIITGIAGGLMIVFAMSYFKGGVCKIKKDLSGKVILITGANSGIGYRTAITLAKTRATIILACRDEERSRIASQVISKISMNYNVQRFILDLADIKSIQLFAENFKKQFDRLDILINNAGVMMPPNRTLTKDGFQLTVGTNHLGHVHLTNLLMDLLKNTKESRVINVSSIAHYFFGPIGWDNYNSEKKYYKHIAYSYSKLSNIYHAMELQKQFDQQKLNIKAVSLHPGVVRTELMRFIFDYQILKFAVNLVYPFWCLFTQDSEAGAQTSVYCALENFDKLKGGEYYSDCKVRSRWGFAKNYTYSKQLMQLSENLIKQAKLKLK